jgi:peptide/nickel transport system permease protein
MIVFFTLRLIPGGVLDLMVMQAGMEAGSTENVRAAIQHDLGMDVPLHVQYVRWLGSTLRGDLGESLWTERPVVGYLAQRMPVSLELALIAMITALLIGLPIGIYSAIRQDTVGDYLGRSIAIAAIALPGFWIATLVIILPTVYLNWMPPIKLIPFAKDPLGNIVQFMIPGFILGMTTSGTIMRMTRTMMLEVLRQDYIRTGWAKGLKERVVILRHVLKNALIPVVTILGGQISWLIGGSVIMENIFALPGMGALLVEALNQRDYVIVSGLNIVMAVFVLFVILIVDISYGWLDPRVRFK